MSALSGRRLIKLIIEVRNSNPNGDPMRLNDPRQDIFGYGVISPPCLKRKIRYVVEQNPDLVKKVLGDKAPSRILMSAGNVIESIQKEGAEARKVKKDGKKYAEEAVQTILTWFSETFFDVCAFGGMLATGELAGSLFAHVTGPVQFSFARSVTPIRTTEHQITRQVVAKEERSEEGRTMGIVKVVDHAVYEALVFVSPKRAEKTGYTAETHDLFVEILKVMFEDDRSASRCEVYLRGLYEFIVDEPNGAGCPVGTVPSHVLTEVVSVKSLTAKPSNWSDYEITVREVPGATLKRHIDCETKKHKVAV
jgi:CRISPR-associated protein Csd2